jgi:hypothetical protein
VTITVWPVNAVTGAPSYSGRMYRQVHGVALAGAKATRPLGARSGVRPGTPADTVTATSTTWTCKPHAGVLDGQSANEAGAYWYAVDANVTGAVTAANATNPRIDIIYARVDDPAESDGTSVPVVAVAYLAGTAAASPSAPATPARSMKLAEINVPASGGGSPTVTWVAPYAVAAGGIIPVRTTAERDALAALGNTDARVWVDVAGALYSGDGTTWTRAITAPAVSARTTTNMGPGFTTDTPIVTAPAVIADGAAKFKITVTPASFTMVQYEFWEFRIKRGTTTIATHRWVAPSNALTSIPSFTVTDTPTAGSQTYSLSLVRVGGTGTATMTASATSPAEIIVEQIA